MRPPPPGQGGEGQAARERLAERRQVGHDAVALLRAPWRETEAGDDLVEDQHRPASVTGAPDGVEEPWQRRERPLERLADHGGEALRLRGQQLGDRTGVVEREHHDVAGDAVLHARRLGERDRWLGRAVLE